MDTPLSQIFATFARIGVLSFGGPAAQISLMHAELVERHKWLTEKQFLQALSFCMLLPGPEAMQLATYAGWKLRGVPGGLIAGLLFVLPGAAVIMGLAFGYAHYGDVPLVQSLFAGIKAAVVVVVLQALWRLSRKALDGASSWILAALAFAALFFLSIPFPLIIAAAALWGYLVTRSEAHEPAPPPERPATLRTIAVWGTLWLAPVAVLWLSGATRLPNSLPSHPPEPHEHHPQGWLQVLEERERSRLKKRQSGASQRLSRRIPLASPTVTTATVLLASRPWPQQAAVRLTVSAACCTRLWGAAGPEGAASCPGKSIPPKWKFFRENFRGKNVIF